MDYIILDDEVKEEVKEEVKSGFDLDKLNNFIENINKLMENLNKIGLSKMQQQRPAQAQPKINKKQIVEEIISRFEAYLGSNPEYQELKIRDFLEFLKQNRNQVIELLSQ